MGPQVDTLTPEANFPKKVDVVIVGGGIIGTARRSALARSGVSTALCEKGHIAGEQSSRNWGWVRKARRDPREIPLIVESLRMWERMNETVGAETGFRTTGIMFAVESDADLARYEAWLEHAKPYQIDARLIASDEIEKLISGAGRYWKAALYCDSDEGPSRRKQLPPSQPRPGAPARPSSRTAPCAASRRRAGA